MADDVAFWYLASPYSRYVGGLETAFQEIARNAALLIRAGVRLYCPIAHTHPIAMQGGIDPLDHGIWLPADRPFMFAACGLIVCMMEGWELSYGISVEMDEFARAGKPLVYMRPGQVPVEFIR
jgi:hypothetical protein